MIGIWINNFSSSIIGIKNPKEEIIMETYKETKTPISVQEKNNTNIRRKKYSTNQNRPKMTVNVAESFNEVQKLNKKALSILAKRA